MLYSILIYGEESRVGAWTPAEEREVMDRHTAFREQFTGAGRLGPVMRLKSFDTKTVRRYTDRKHITDGPYAETKEQLLGLYVVDVPSFEDAVAATEQLNFASGVFEISPISWLSPGVLPAVTPEEGKHPRRGT
jgi:hypothetical protein